MTGCAKALASSSPFLETWTLQDPGKPAPAGHILPKCGRAEGRKRKQIEDEEASPALPGPGFCPPGDAL